MLQDLDKALASLLKAELPPAIASTAAITFAAPDSRFPPSNVTLPAVDLFLFAVEENHELRSFEPIDVRQPDGSVVRMPPQPRVDCHYMIAAFAAENSPTADEDEHRMLGEIMRVLLRHRRLPDAILGGSLSVVSTQVRALPLAPSLNARFPGADLWQALGVRPRATLHYVITISVDTGLPTSTSTRITSTQLTGPS